MIGMELQTQTLDASLQRFAAAANEQEPISVIIEIAPDLARVPSAVVAKGPKLGHQPVPNPKRNSKTAKPAQQAPAESTIGMDQLGQLLKKMNLLQSAVRLESAEAFVADVNPTQLKQLASSELVGRIRPNRQHSAQAVIE